MIPERHVAAAGALNGLRGEAASTARAIGEAAGLRKRGEWRGLMFWEKAKKKSSSCRVKGRPFR